MRREEGKKGKVRREEGKVRREEASEEILPNIYLFKKQVGGKEQSANGIKSASYFLDAFDVPEGFKLGHARPNCQPTYQLTPTNQLTNLPTRPHNCQPISQHKPPPSSAQPRQLTY